jgi:hypothetical protein
MSASMAPFIKRAFIHFSCIDNRINGFLSHLGSTPPHPATAPSRHRMRSEAMSNYNDDETLSPFSTSPRQPSPNYRFHPPPQRQAAQESQTYPPPLTRFHHDSSPHGNINSATASTTSTSKVASTKNHHFFGYSIDQYHHVLQSASAQSSPYFGPPPPPLPPLDSWTVSPNNNAAVRNESSWTPSTIYQQSPYFSDAPALQGSGSSESSTTSTNAAVCRPVPAKSAFMCFSDAKSEDIRETMGPDTKVSCPVMISVKFVFNDI